MPGRQLLLNNFDEVSQQCAKSPEAARTGTPVGGGESGKPSWECHDWTALGHTHTGQLLSQLEASMSRDSLRATADAMI